jgi:hypothetical protein
VVVEADAFKETDVIYRAISSMGHHNDMLQTAELVRSAHKTPLSLSLSLLSIVIIAITTLLSTQIRSSSGFIFS